MTAGDMIKVCRLHKGYTQRQLADKAGITINMLGEYERNHHEPKFETVVWLLGACGFELKLAKKGKTR